MKKKLFGILMCMLIIAAAIPALGTIMNDDLYIRKTSDDDNNLLKQITSSSYNLGDWPQQDKLTASDGETGDYFGRSVSHDGDYAIVGAYYDDSCRGSAYVFKRSGTSWTQEDKLTALDGETSDYFGGSVSIDGDYCIVGACFDDSCRGSAYVFKRSGTSWTQEDKLTALDGVSLDFFGCSVSIDGDYCIVGACGYETSSRGSAYVFKRSGTSWTQEDKLTASDGETSDDFGCSVSIDSDYSIVGAQGDDSNKGSAYVFKRSGTSWTQDDKLTASDGEIYDYFGCSVSINGDYVVVGAWGDDNDKGSAYVFKRSGTSWLPEGKLTASDGEIGNLFGCSVSIDGYYALVGARGDDNNKGSAYVFKKLYPDLDCLGSLSWTDISPGAIVTGSFMVANVGDPGSELSWEIESYPTWGTWTFVPSSGTGLTPEMGTLTITVEVVAPDEENEEFAGEVKVANSEDNNDYDTIPVSLITPRNHQKNIHPLIQKISEQFPNSFPVLRHIIRISTNLFENNPKNRNR